MDDMELMEETMEETTEEVIEEAVEETTIESSENTVESHIPQEPAKSNNKPVVIFVTVLFMLVIGLCVYIAVSVSKVIPADGDSIDTEYESETGNPWEEILGDKFKDDAAEEVSPDKEEIPSEEYSADDYEYDFDDEDYSVIPEQVWDDETWNQDYPNYAKETFDGPYYDEVVDCMDNNVSYKIKRIFDEYTDREEGICMRLSYIQLEGDIPNLETINELLKSSAYIYMNNIDSIKETVGEDHAGVYADTRSYVTYNTENQISVVVRDEVKFSYLYSDVSLSAININPDTGTVLNNTEILTLDDDFGQEFRDRSNAQNGVSEGGIEPYSNQEILAMLQDPGSIIVFYTPIGIELGYHYRGDYYSGWITISMTDYAKYLPSL